MRILLLVSLITLAACSSAQVNTPPFPDAPQPPAISVPESTPEQSVGAISGKIIYPGKIPPAMRICAVNDEGTLHGCTQTKDGDDHYRIGHLLPGHYLVMAKLHHHALRIGGYVKQVQCIRAPCPPLLVSVTVEPGANVTGIDINEFYKVREDFPPMPMAE